METPFPPFEPNGADKEPQSNQAGGPTRLREVPFRMIVPNLITILAICAGLTGIRLAFEGRFETAVLMVLAAAFLDGVDGRVARLLKASTRFGAEMDSLADIVNFGVAPALVLYAYILNQAGSIGWLAAVLFAIACSLRLARFNVMNGDENQPTWQRGYFVGVPAPAGAAMVLLPVYLGEVGMPLNHVTAIVASVYVVVIAILLTSRLPVWSGKGANSFRRELAVPVMLGVLAYAIMLASYPWTMLLVSTVLYAAFLVFSVRSYAKRAAQELPPNGDDTPS